MRGKLRLCNVAVFHIFYARLQWKNPSLQCWGDLKPCGVWCSHFKVYIVQWKEIICGIPVSIIFGQMTSENVLVPVRQTEVTFWHNFAVIFIDLPVAKFKWKLRDSKGISRVTTVLDLWCVCFRDFLEVKMYNILQSIIIVGPFTRKLKLYIAVSVFHQLFLQWCSVRQYFFAVLPCSEPLKSPSLINWKNMFKF